MLSEQLLFPDIAEGELIEINWRKQDLRFACCDCGLSHRLRFAIAGNKLRLRAYRDVQGTAYCRIGDDDEGSK